MLRVFVPKSPYGYHVEEIDSSTKKSEDYPGSWILRRLIDGGATEDWRWAGIENPYPEDEVKSAAAFMCYMKHIANRDGTVEEIAYLSGGDRLYYR